MGNGKDYTTKEQLYRELSKHLKMLCMMGTKMATLILYALFMKSSFAQEHSILTKIASGIIISIVIWWLVKYIKKITTVK